VQTTRDREVVEWLARIGAASAEHVMVRFGMGRSRAYARLRSLVDDGVLEHKQLLHRLPGVYVATVEGLRWTRLERLGPYRLSLGSIEHATALTRAAVALHRALPAYGQLSERELRVEESEREQPIASAHVGELSGGRPALHRPDLALLGPERCVLAIEVELSVKARRRLQTICRGYARARHLDHVYYLAAQAPARAVARAVNEVRAEERIMVLALEDIEGLVAAETRRIGTRHV
jgi:hypothetical protein